jgi:NitT/TauT family transport system ATP-binding protein
VLVFDKVRVDPQAPGAYGARITYNIPLDRSRESVSAVHLARAAVQGASSMEVVS